MDLSRIAEQLGKLQDGLVKLNAQQGPGIVGKQTTATFGAFAGALGIAIAAACIHSFAFLGIGLTFLTVIYGMYLAATIFTGIKIPNQALDSVQMLIHLNPNLASLIVKGAEESIEGSFRPADQTENGSLERRLLTRPDTSSEDAPDTTDEPEQDAEGEIA